MLYLMHLILLQVMDLHKLLVQIPLRRKLTLVHGELYRMHPLRKHRKVRHIFYLIQDRFSSHLCSRVRFLKQRFRLL